MKSQRRTWWIFGLAAGVLLLAVGWVSVLVLRLESAQWASAYLADREEKTRLALWRMESWVSPLLMGESARSGTAYEPFHSATRALSRTRGELRPGEIVVPSPLLGSADALVLLHFQFGPDRVLTSPQVPVGKDRELAETLYGVGHRIEASGQRLARLGAMLVATVGHGDPDGSVGDQFEREARTSMASISADPPPRVVPGVSIHANRLVPMENGASQGLLNDGEWLARQNVARQSQAGSWPGNGGTGETGNLPVSASDVVSREGMIRPLWVGDELFLVRGAVVSGRSVVQGCWLDWPALRERLLETVRDLLPQAKLEPMRGKESAVGIDPRALAALPIRLVPPEAGPESIPWATPVRISMTVAWVGVVAAALAVAVLLHGAVGLGERRGAFVSAVTHELRSPLTTFRMYSEMLAQGMVPDPATRQAYLETLCAESNRLGHLVENVLAFAGLERGSARRQWEELALGELVSRVLPRLEQRAVQASMRLIAACPPAVESVRVRVDVSTVEQILFNLVDNACKYAAASEPAEIRFEVGADPGSGRIRVRDRGPGVAPERVGRLFRPFNKTAHEAAVSAPGIGLGLALSRRLARSIGGDLGFEPAEGGGAVFELRLPRVGLR